MTDASNEIEVGNYLLERLVQLGVTRIFGLPGDFNLTFLDLVEDHPTIEWIGCANELNAAYAAEGWARVSKGIGCLLTTFGVGDLSACNGIANAYSERVGIVHIVGSPPQKMRTTSGIIHHTLGDGKFDVFSALARHITVAQASLSVQSLDKCTPDIDHVLKECVIQRRPVYIDLPTDVVFAKVPRAKLDQPVTIASIRKSLADPGPHAKLLEHVTNSIIGLLHKSKRPIIIVDVCAMRHDMVDLAYQLIEATGLSFITTPSAPSAIAQDHPQYIGCYGGRVSDDKVYELVQSADLGISIGRVRADLNTGAFSYVLDPEIEVEIHSSEIIVQYAKYDQLNAFQLLPRLIEACKKITIAHDLQPIPGAALKKFDAGAVQPEKLLTHKALWPIVASYFKENDVLVCEVGSAAMGLWDVKLPFVNFESATLWASIGFAGGAIVGAATAAKQQGRRAICLTGEGSYMETIQDLGTMIRLGLSPTIFLINNNGYTIERLIHGAERAYNDVSSWNWQLALKFMGGNETNSASYRIETEGQLLDLVQNPEFNNSNKVQLVELITDKMDAPEKLVKQMRVVRALSVAS